MKQILPDDNCLTPEQILRYLRDEASALEIRSIDRHLEHCPMCTDAVEGAMMLNSKDLEKSFSQSNALFIGKREAVTVPIKPLKTARSPHFYIRYVLGIAASLAILIVASIWLFTKPLDKSTSDLADAPPQYTPEISPADSIYFAQKPIVVESNDPNLTVAPTGELPPTTMSDNTITSIDSDRTVDNQSIKNDSSLNMSVASAPMPQSASQEDAYKSTPYPQGLKEKQSQNAEEAVPNNAAEDRKLAKSRNAPMSAADKASSSPSVGAPFVASRQTLERVQKVDKTILTEAIQHYQDKNFDQAIKSFNSLLTRHSQGELYEKALWYVANAYNQKNNKIYAQLTLQRIVQEKGQFAAQAEVILKNMKE